MERFCLAHSEGMYAAGGAKGSGECGKDGGEDLDYPLFEWTQTFLAFCDQSFLQEQNLFEVDLMLY